MVRHQPLGADDDADCDYGDGRAGHHLRNAFHCADSTIGTAWGGGGRFQCNWHSMPIRLTTQRRARDAERAWSSRPLRHTRLPLRCNVTRTFVPSANGPKLTCCQPDRLPRLAASFISAVAATQSIPRAFRGRFDPLVASFAHFTSFQPLGGKVRSLRTARIISRSTGQPPGFDSGPRLGIS